MTCVAEAPVLEGLYKEYKDRGFLMVMSFYLGTDEQVAELGAGLTFPVVNDVNGEILRRWEKDSAVPTTSLLAPGFHLLQVDEPLDDATMRDNLPR